MFHVGGRVVDFPKTFHCQDVEVGSETIHVDTVSQPSGGVLRSDRKAIGKCAFVFGWSFCQVFPEG